MAEKCTNQARKRPLCASSNIQMSSWDQVCHFQLPSLIQDSPYRGYSNILHSVLWVMP